MVLSRSCPKSGVKLPFAQPNQKTKNSTASLLGEALAFENKAFLKIVAQAVLFSWQCFLQVAGTDKKIS
jgi:hypothetical protein